MNLRDRMGALAERNFRLVFSSTTISAFGDGVSQVALAFAILKIHNSPVAIGVVFAARQGAATIVTLAAGVIADRLPRHLVLVVVAGVQGSTQAITGALVLSGHASVPALAGLAIAYGAADGFVIPTSQGLIPSIVSAGRLQQANALLGLTRSLLGMIGPTLGGVLTALGNPGAALEVDAATFFVAAVLLLRVAIPPREDTVVPERFFAEMRSGWAEFRRQTWISHTFAFFLLGNFFGSAFGVLGPYLVKQHYGGALSWGFIGGAEGVGAVLGGLAALRYKPRRIVLASCLWSILYGVPTLALGLLLPLPFVVAAAFVQGFGLALHLTLWFTAFQQQVPEEALSRVSSYDAIGSFTLIPLGTAAAGIVAGVIGARTTLVAAGAITIALNVSILFIRSIYRVEARPA
ncbi:MAG TPA: MFS transporter [Gaiellaceae bacterium]|nr:MFS transporter [Gaiellaceae bacterium]